MNILKLDPEDPAVAEAIADCKVGKQKSISVTGTVTKMGDEFEMEVESAAYAEPESEGEDKMEGGEEMEKPMSKGEMVGKGGKKGLAILIGRA